MLSVHQFNKLPQPFSQLLLRTTDSMEVSAETGWAVKAANANKEPTNAIPRVFIKMPIRRFSNFTLYAQIRVSPWKTVMKTD